MQEYAKTNPDAAKSMNQVSTLTGGNAADSAAVYKLASDIFASMTKETGGDAGGMEKILADAMKNPQDFAAKLTPEQRQELQRLTKSIESRAPSTVPH
jgi:Spy/CpxP family protein refolding chaperone